MKECAGAVSTLADKRSEGSQMSNEAWKIPIP